MTPDSAAPPAGTEGDQVREGHRPLIIPRPDRYVVVPQATAALALWLALSSVAYAALSAVR